MADDDDLEIPPFLRRPWSPEAQAKVDAMVARENRRHGPDRGRYIKMPSGRSRKSAGLGMSPFQMTQAGAKPRNPGDDMTKLPLPKRRSAKSVKAPRPKKGGGSKKGRAVPKGAAAPARKKGDRLPVPSERAPREGSKKAIVVALLTRPEGCTTAEVLQATGWPSVSMPQQARAAGLTLSQEKDGKVTRYRGAPARSAAA